METEQITSSQLDYKKYTMVYPQYEMTKVLPLSGGNTFNINAAGVECIFEFPVKVYNLSRSILYFQIVVLDANALLGGLTIQQWFHANCLGMIRQLQFYSRGNAYAADINELANYTKIVWPVETKQSNFLCHDQALNSAAAIFNNNAAVTTLPVCGNGGFAKFFQPSYLNLPNLANHRHDNSLPQLNGFEPLHFYCTNVISNNAGGGSFVLNCEIPFGMIYNSVFALDRDLFFNEVMTCRIVFHANSRFSFYTPNTATLIDPTGGANSLTSSAVVPNWNITIQNTQIYLATEVNPMIEQMIKEIVMTKGLNILTPFIQTTKAPINPSASSGGITIRYNSGHGIRLKKIYWAPFNATERLNTAFDNSNLLPLYGNAIAGITNCGVGSAGDKIQNFYTQLNNNRNTVYNIDSTNQLGSGSQDYLEMNKFLKGSVLCTSNLYQYNWFWLDDWSEVKQAYQKEYYDTDTENILEGIDLINQEQKYDIIFNQLNTNNSAVNGLNFYVYAICQKMMTINSTGFHI